MSYHIRSFFLLTVLLSAFSATATAQPKTPFREQLDFFEKKIRPVLVESCYRCHSSEAKRVRAGLLLDTRDGLLKGGDSGPAIVPGNPKASLLIKSLHYQGDFQMPPSKKLPDQVIAHFETWIKNGAADPRTVKIAKKEPAAINLEKGRQFWSFQTPQKQPQPVVKNANWPRQRLDYFVLARLEKSGLTPATEADKRTLIRRVTFDLIGLPPTPEEVNDFIKDESPDAYEKLVDRLLASSHYGEHWARLWLDVARYAEDQAHIVGNNRSLTYPNAYLYRDWVIEALNKDTPYDRFVKLQLAADLIEGKDSENLVALGFIGLGPKYYRRNSLEVMADEWEDRVDIVGRGLLGLTVACARCHDHKYDPIPTEDYYSLAGVFASSPMYNHPFKKTQAKKGKRKNNSPGNTMHIIKEGKPQDLNVFVRGNVKTKGPVAKRQFLQVLSNGEPEPFENGSGRLDLAKAIVNKSNPLTSRVLVNRIWAKLIGRGLVGTPSNFGKLGERPTHPQLLDDLAVRFMENGWSMKALQREIVLSATYRQNSNGAAETVKTDPANKLLGRMNRRRLSIESWRDAFLIVTGQLDRSVGGKSIEPNKTSEQRRTVYSYISRLDLNPMLATFDFPDPNAHASQRVETTTPLQKMFVLNSPFMVHQAKELTKRLNKDISGESKEADSERIQRAYLLLFARPASEAEVSLGVRFLQGDGDRNSRWQQYCHILLASNEMLFID